MKKVTVVVAILFASSPHAQHTAVPPDKAAVPASRRRTYTDSGNTLVSS